MPRLNPSLSNAAFFLFGKDPKTGDQIGPLGTGALVAVPHTKVWFLGHTYAVTCHHCIRAGATNIRINTRDGKSRVIETEPEEWTFDPKGGDLAVIDLNGLVKQRDGDDISVIPTTQFVTKEFIRETEFGIGEDGFMLGLFPDHPGKERNLVAARFGNVSLLADDNELLRQPNRKTRPSHLFDMHSRPGSSGSPVFAYRTPSGDLRNAVLRGVDTLSTRRAVLNDLARSQAAWERAQGDYRTADDPFFVNARDRGSEEREAREVEKNTFLVLLGIHAGQYAEEVEVRKISKRVSGEVVESVHDGDRLLMPNSMALVIPAWDVDALLNREPLVRRRQEREATDAEKEAARVGDRRKPLQR